MIAQPVDQQMDSQALGTKEIYLEERCLFALSLIPIAINICVKANLKKSINSVLQPILDSYQIKNTNCAVYLNSANYTLNLSELCATIDNQHVLVVHKHQSNRKCHGQGHGHCRVRVKVMVMVKFV